MLQNRADTLVARKGDIQLGYASSIRSATSAILEALAAELLAEAVLAAPARQRFDAQDVDRDTPVRVRGVEGGQVAALEFPEDDAMIRLREGCHVRPLR